MAALLHWAAQHQVPLTAWGGGSSVTGACLPGHGGMTVDFSRMTAVLELNETDRFVRTEPGIMGDKLEAWLNERGFTLNHSPQSLDRSTPGGWVSTFATGQFSSKYGGIENLLLGLGAGRQAPVWSEQEQRFLPVTEAQLTLSFDHRILDGGAAGRLLHRIATLMQKPAEL